MKILLVEPPASFVQPGGVPRSLIPMGLAHVGSVLVRAGYEVRMLVPDHRPGLGEAGWEAIRSAVLDEAPDMVGLTGMSPQEPELKRLVDVVRAAVPAEVPVIVGGQHATCWPERLAAWEGVTAVVAGEGENAVLGLASGQDPLTVSGVVAMREGSVQRGPPTEYVEDLDSLPLPLREGFVWEDTLPANAYGAIIGMRGCPFACAYCSLTLASRWRARMRSPESVVGEIERVLDRYGANNIVFHDPVITLPRTRARAIAALMKSRGIQVPFTAQTRADMVDADTMGALAERGCSRLFLGIESGDEDTLSRIGKKMSLATIREAVDTVQAAGISPAGFFIVGFPWEDEPLMRRTLDFALDLGLDWVSLHTAVPIPHSRLWDMVPDEHRVVARDFVNPVLNLTAMPDHRYRAVFNELRRRAEAYNMDRAQARIGAALA